jgi:hypothetical protein
MEPLLPPPPIPGRAKKALVVAVLLCFLGCICLILFLQTFFRISIGTDNRWPLFLCGILALLSGAYVIYIAYLIYHRTPGYYWPMIFF